MKFKIGDKCYAYHGWENKSFLAGTISEICPGVRAVSNATVQRPLFNTQYYFVDWGENKTWWEENNLFTEQEMKMQQYADAALRREG